MKLVFTNAVRRERISGSDLWSIMGDRQTREKLDEVVTKAQCLTVSRGVVRLVRHVGPRKLS
eukprot:10967308-Lingulodinium_polyedra.AAC.1